MKTFGPNTYLSPFTWRYGSDSMRAVSLSHQRLIWRRIWVAMAETSELDWCPRLKLMT